ncbi:Carboxypeptidase regulatory-like domain-containing protein [Actinoplanes regularis]|uniref:Carboxypeptidase regulatory-like domain-containing protein n=1 Tax=Actinoplanes regularis TaxID=52697 RepID=A0A239IEK3_9ACTN|nr:Carboxypeptidase regulatory-like domain-containing protein [Actinoplanes regularis]
MKPSACVREQADPVAARRMVDVCKAPVEILSERTEYAQLFLNPDGTSTLQESVEPQRVRQGKSWVPVDTTLRRGVGGFSPRAAVLPMTFSAGGDTLVGKLGTGSKEIALRWTKKLPAPDLRGDTATYRNVLPDVDLQVTASATGFSEVLVVHTRKAAANPQLKSLSFGLNTKGVTMSPAAGGGLRARDSKGADVFTAPAPLMWDSSESPEQQALRTPTAAPSESQGTTADPRGEFARRAVMPVKVAGGAVTITPDKAMLTDARTKFPVFIDPSVTGGISGNAWTSVWSKYPTKSFWQNSTALTDSAITGSAGVGRTEDCVGCADHIIRSFFRMDTSKVKGKVSAAQFSIEQRWSWTCSPASNAKVWQTGAISSATTWKNQPTWYSKTAQVLGNRKYGAVHGCKGPGTIEFNVTNMVTAGASSVTLGLKAIDEGTKNQWKRFKHSTAKLSVTFNQDPTALADRKSDGGACVVGASRPWVLRTDGVKLTGFQQDPDLPTSLTTYFYWWAKGGARSESNRVSQANGNKATVTGTIPNGKLVDGTTYVWQAKTSDGTTETWSGTCEFTVDKTPPPSPGAITSTDYSATAPSGGVGLAGTFKAAIPAIRKEDVVGYVWTLDAGEYLAAKPATMNADYSATLSLAPAHDGINTLRVWAKDRAGWYSATPATYTFTVRGGTGPAAEWIFEEAAGTTTAADKQLHGNTLTLGGDATRSPGRGSTEGGALSLNGTTGFAATSGPVTYPHPDTNATTPVRTDATFTVTARVKLTATGGTGQRVAVAQSGSRTSAFTLGYSGSDNKWRFAMAGTDTDGVAYVQALSTATATAGKWVHLAGVYDSSTKKLTLYVNGVAQTTATLTGGFNATGPLTVGKSRVSSADSGFFNGDIDDVRVYAFAETATKLIESAMPLQPAITFPGESQVWAGESLAVKFDAGGDTNVTKFRYSIDGTGLGTTVNADVPGGTATVNIAVGTTTGVRPIYAVGEDSLRVGPMKPAQFSVHGADLSGTVLDAATWLGTAGATVTLQPGGYTATTEADGGYKFENLPRNNYTISAASGGRCGMAGTQPFLIDKQGLTLELYLRRKKDEANHTCLERTTTFATGTTVLSLTGDDAVTPVTLPFAFPFYGGAYRTAWVDTNGVLSFTDPGGSHPYTGTNDLVTAANSIPVIAAYWDDLVVDASASVRTAVIGTGGSQQVLIEWRNVYRKANTAQRLSFEVTLGLDGTVTTNYSGMDNAAEQGDNALVGIVAPAGDDVFVYSAGDPVLTNGKAIVFTPDGATQLEVHNLTGKLTDQAGAAVAGLNVTLDPGGLTATTAADGTYSFTGIEADSYTVVARKPARCGSAAEAVVDLSIDTVYNLKLGPDYGDIGYACNTGTATWIAGTTTVPLTGNGVRANVQLPFPVRFHGDTFTGASVSDDGYAQLGSGFLLPFWTDFTVDSSAGVWTQSGGTAPNRTFVIEWRNVLFTGTTERVTFEVVIHEDGHFVYQYGSGGTTDRQKGSTAQVSLQANGLATYYSASSPVLTPNSSLTYTPAPVGVISGVLTQTETNEPIAGVTITLNPGNRTATTAEDGSYGFTDVPVGRYTLQAVGGADLCWGSYASAKVSKAFLNETVDLSVNPQNDYYYNCTTSTQDFTHAADVQQGWTGDDETWRTQLPFPIKLYGESYKTAWVSSNGMIAFQVPEEGIPAPENATRDRESSVSVFYDNWVVDSEAAIAIEATGSAPDRQWTVEWRNVHAAGDPTTRVSFEATFDESGGITFNYEGINSANLRERGSSGSVGIASFWDYDLGQGATYLRYLDGGDILADNLSVHFTPAATENSISGTVTCDDAPVDGATVTAAGQSATTGADGTYQLDGVPTKYWAVFATQPSGPCVGTGSGTVKLGRLPGVQDFRWEASAADPMGYTISEVPNAYVPVGADKVLPIGENGWAEIDMPFPITVFGVVRERVSIEEWGAFEFGNTYNGEFFYETYLEVLSGHWKVDDQASVRTEVRGTAPNRHFVIEWNNVMRDGDPGTRTTFQATIDETGGFTTAYPDNDGSFYLSGGDALIGLSGYDGKGYHWNDYGDREPLLRPGYGLRFEPEAS